MEKKELLFFVKMLSVVCFILTIVMGARVYASDIRDNVTEITKESQMSVKMIVDEGRKSAIAAIKAKWNELLGMIHHNVLEDMQAFQDVATSSQNNSNITLKVFISTAMSTPLLKSYSEMAKKYGAVLVLKGLPEGSWRKLSDLIYELNKEEGDNIIVQIDDPSFDEYEITRVPTFVLAREENVFEDENVQKPLFDKITGNIGIKRALEEFAEKGDLRTDARAILDKAEGK